MTWLILLAVWPAAAITIAVIYSAFAGGVFGWVGLQSLRIKREEQAQARLEQAREWGRQWWAAHPNATKEDCGRAFDVAFAEHALHPGKELKHPVLILAVGFVAMLVVFQAAYPKASILNDPATLCVVAVVVLWALVAELTSRVRKPANTNQSRETRA